MSLFMHSTAFLDPLYRLASTGMTSAPRGLEIVELENFQYELPPYVRFPNFNLRKLSIPYVKKEFLWYLKGDRFDTSITEHASIWKSLIQSDFGINSNYGQYIFNKDCNQFQRMIDILTADKDSRRASIMILQPKHVLEDTSDQPCTYSMRFSIRDNKLSMTVHMRSQDAIFGMGNDAPCFSFIHEMLFVKMREVYPELQYGNYTHFADSFHVYERHFNMISEITGVDIRKKKANGHYHDVLPSVRTLAEKYTLVDCPKISCGNEVDFLIAGKFDNIPEEFEFTKWLTSTT